MCEMQATPFAYALADFSSKLYQEIGAKNGQDSNIFISPLSISFALAMTYAGADGNTKKQMRQVLFGNWTDKSDDELHGLYAEVMQLLNKPGGDSYKLHLANRVYAHESNLGSLKDSFTDVIKNKYGSDLQAVDFGQSEQTRGAINRWVEEKTQQKIKDLIPRNVLSSMTRLVLVNAIYFKGDWKSKFNPDSTHPRQFHGSGSTNEREVQMMSANGQRFNYDENEQAQILGMPYKGDELFMFVFLPRDRDGLAALEKSMNGRKLVESVLNTREQKLEHVVIPKFKLEETATLVEALQHLGATDMFDEKAADFSNINGQRDLVISDVIHKAFIEVNEEGTEAAAATAVVANTRCAKPMNPSFVADHPFMFAIVDTRKNSILFLGRFASPK